MEKIVLLMLFLMASALEAENLRADDGAYAGFQSNAVTPGLRSVSPVHTMNSVALVPAFGSVVQGALPTSIISANYLHI